MEQKNRQHVLQYVLPIFIQYIQLIGINLKLFFLHPTADNRIIPFDFLQRLDDSDNRHHNRHNPEYDQEWQAD